MSKFKKGDLINPKKFENIAKFTLGSALCPLFKCKTVSFHTDVTLRVTQVFSPYIEGFDLLFCYDPDIGEHEWFQVLQRHATLSTEKKDDKEPTRKITQDEIDNKPWWATHSYVDAIRGVYFECKTLNTMTGTGCTMMNLSGKLDDRSVPIPTKKDNKLQLTKDDIGNKFETETGMVFEVHWVDQNAVIKNDCTGFLICSLTGEIDGAEHRLVKRHEPRWWLTELPKGIVEACELYSAEYIECDEWGWTSVSEKDTHYSLNDNMMPKLKEHEYKKSKITIDELRELQRVGK